MQRASEERGRSQENQRSVHDPPEDRYPHSTVLALVPWLCEKDEEEGYHRTVYYTS